MGRWHPNDELEILGDSDGIFEVSEPSAKALTKRHLEKSSITSVNPDGVWDGGRIPKEDELSAKVTSSEHLTNPSLFLSDFSQQRTNPADLNDQCILAEPGWAAVSLDLAQPGWGATCCDEAESGWTARPTNFDGVGPMRPTQNLEDFEPNSISCVLCGQSSPVVISVNDNIVEAADELSRQSTIDRKEGRELSISAENSIEEEGREQSAIAICNF